MLPINLPAFGESNYFDNIETNNSRVVIISDATPELFKKYCALFEKEGFLQKEQELKDHRSFVAYEKDSFGVFINYFANTNELQIVTEQNSLYFSFDDKCGECVTTPRFTQVKLVDYGLCNVIRLSDGRLIVIDSGNTFDEDREHLYARLKSDSPHEKPIIAAWIITHPHSDHINCFFLFMQKYASEVIIEKFIYNFPEPDDFVHYPKLDALNTWYSKWAKIDKTNCEIINMFYSEVTKLGVPVYTPHTGQRYNIGDAQLQFIATMDDTIHCSQKINAMSLMFMVELGGQKIFVTGDGSFSDSRLAERYGSELKSDIMQIPHHGFSSGTHEAQIAGYSQVKPSVCLLPLGFYLAYTDFTTYRKGTNYAMTALDVDEMMTGEIEHVLDLPYTPDPLGKQKLRQNYIEGRENCGARTWYFTDLNTANKDDFIFSVLNTTYIDSDLRVELFFENMQKKVIRIDNTGLCRGVFRLNCLLKPDEDQSVFDQPDFLTSRDIPENTYFAVRFISSHPIVISHRDHSPAYHSTIV